MDFWDCYFIFHVLCFIYIEWRLFKRYNQMSHDGVTGSTPGLDAFGLILIAPIIAIIDITYSWFLLIREFYQKKNNKDVI
jgi:hypothetical protein